MVCLPENVPCSRPYSYSPTLFTREKTEVLLLTPGWRWVLLRPRGDGPSCSRGGTPFPQLCSVLVALLLLNVSVSGGGEGHPLHSLEPDQKPWLCSPLCMMQTLRCTKPTMTTKKKTLYSSFRLSAFFCPLAPPVTGDNQHSSRYPRTPNVFQCLTPSFWPGHCRSYLENQWRLTLELAQVPGSLSL